VGECKKILEDVSVLHCADTNRLNQQLSGSELNMYHFTTAGSSLGNSLNKICLGNTNRDYSIKKYLILNNLLRLYVFRLKDLDPSDVDPDDSGNYKIRITKLIVMFF
jgi:hypothetical protein